MESKKSIKSGAGPFASVGAEACDFAWAGNVGSDFLTLSNGVVVFSDLEIGFDAPFPPWVWARYCLLLISKSGSLRYSWRDVAKVVGACFSLGTCNFVKL